MAGVLQDGSQAWTKPLTLLAGRIRAFDKDPPMKLEVKLTNSYDFGIFCLQVNWSWDVFNDFWVEGLWRVRNFGVLFCFCHFLHHVFRACCLMFFSTGISKTTLMLMLGWFWDEFRMVFCILHLDPLIWFQINQTLSHWEDMKKTIHLFTPPKKSYSTVDGWNPAPRGMYETL